MNFNGFPTSYFFNNFSGMSSGNISQPIWQLNARVNVGSGQSVCPLNPTPLSCVFRTPAPIQPKPAHQQQVDGEDSNVGILPRTPVSKVNVINWALQWPVHAPNTVKATSMWTPRPVAQLPPERSSVDLSTVSLEIKHPVPSEVAMERKGVEDEVYARYVIDTEAVNILISIPNPVSEPALNSGRFLAWVLSPEESDYQLILKYIENSQVHGYRIKVNDILRISRMQDLDLNFEGYEDKLRMMLWHGTSTTNVGSILENGFQIPGSNDGQMFGRGVYFADRVSKSANYCDFSQRFLFLCDVFLGKVYREEGTRKHSTAAPTVMMNNGQIVQYNSVWGPGRFIPDPKDNVTIDGCIWPVGKTIPANSEFGHYAYLHFNEYTVYTPELIQVKYLIRWEQEHDIGVVPT